MPYIDKDHRTEIDRCINLLLNEVFIIDNMTNDNPGTLNYAVTKLLHRYIKCEGLSYETINKVMGVLSCVQAELYRTVAGPYEEKKRIGNGPVSELDAKSLEDVR